MQAEREKENNNSLILHETPIEAFQTFWCIAETSLESRLSADRTST